MSLPRLSTNTLHVVIDMQRLFAEDTAWHTPATKTILPNVIKLCEVFRHRTLFAKFTVPPRAEDARGCWRDYYNRWSTMTGEVLAPGMLDLMEPLSALAHENDVVEKDTYSVFGSSGLLDRLEENKIDTVVFSGVETVVCVYASVLDAIDLGLRVIMASDAIGSADEVAHQAVMTHLAPRLSEQLEVGTTQAIVDAWMPGD
ncbi:isochorismatase family cysteine hydrolase [Phyllobacterium zundukense]|uniref:Cysteine hydrolase n=1 Tax=Phyllobacterium zundukense TaxID=1867719 RepID=A0ACD4CWA3_9HYPH|nr:isochorismatase family cysteine hydrolase [Phyllobacterium zundukense]UXN57859.1 cysteine hydrolase [Phyllobacterium zundukense]